MEIAIDRASPVPVYRQIVEVIRAGVMDGRLAEGALLPPERRLARELGVNRSTVLAAYAELKAEGLADAHVGRGTAVRRRPAPPATAGEPLAWGRLARRGAARPRDPLLRDLLELTERRDVLSLAIGLPAPEFLPLQQLREMEEIVHEEVGAAALLHSPTEGLTSFRETLAALMASRGVSCSPAQVLVTSGSQQGLDLVARAFIDPGDVVVVEEPSYFGALQVFRAAQAHLVGVPADAAGMCTETLEGILLRYRPKLIYVLPTFQNPSGAVLALERRHQLLALAARYDVPVIEDDPYGELRYDGAALPSLKALDTGGRVIHLSSFSKVLFPGLRLGWMVAPEPALRQLALAKQGVDLHSSTLGQFVLDAFLRRGHLTGHLERVRRAYTRRRDAMLEALRGAAPSCFSWNRPEGGFYVWARVPGRIHASRLLGAAAARRVAFLPGAPCFLDEPRDTWLRLNFSFPSEEQIRTGVTRLMEALAEVAEAAAAPPAAVSATQPIV